MAGIHQYTSSLFIQSGSAAEFQTGVTASEITVEGTVFATEYKKLDGSLITGTGGIEFFAGSGSGISRSAEDGGPFSQDHFFIIQGDNKTTDVDDVNVLIEGLIKIETTGSSTFNPNYFNFIKVGNTNDDLITVQQGSNPSYTPIDNLERRAGTHRYIIYAAQTGSSGETHQVFHTVTLDAFVNEAPVISPGDNTTFTLSIAHDDTIGETIIHSAESTDANIENGEEDFFTKYKVSRDDFGGDTIPTYNINALHLLDFNNFNDTEVLPTDIEISSFSSPGLPNSSLFFTASLNQFNILYENSSYTDLGKTFVIQNPNPQYSQFKIRLEDNYPNDTVTPGFDEVDYKINIISPNTASIKNSRVEFKSSGFTGELTSTLEQTLLYDLDHTLNSQSIVDLDLHDRYTSSLVRLKALANIIEPEDGLNPPSNHYTKFRIQTQSLGSNIFHSNNTLAYFRINGNEQTASAIDLLNINGDYLTPIENDGFKSFEFYPNYIDNTQSLVVGTNNNDEGFLNNILNTQHGNHHHYKSFINSSPGTLKLKRPHNINISNINIEIASGSDNPTELNQLTSSVLYGFTSSLLSGQTQSLIIDKYDTNTSFRTVEMLDKYLSQSIVKVRVKAQITEPFGPTHNGIDVVLNDNTGKSSTFTFSSQSGFYESSPNYEIIDEQELLVGRYTSSWQEFKFTPQLNSYQFDVSFTNPSSNVGLTTADYIPASLTMSAAEPIEVLDVIVEVESGSFATNEGTSSLSSSLLYGLSSSILSSQTESIFINQIQDGLSNPNYNNYVSQSIVRARIRAKITEPFGPITTDISASIITDIRRFTNLTSFNPVTIETAEDAAPTGFFNTDPSHFTRTVIIDVINNPSTLNIIDIGTLTTINITKVEVRGDLSTGGRTNLDIGNYRFLSNFRFNTETFEENDNEFSFGDFNNFATIFEGTQSVSISGGIVEAVLQHFNSPASPDNVLESLQIRVTFQEPLDNDTFISPDFLFQADQSGNYGFIFEEGFGNFPVGPNYNNTTKKLTTLYASPFIEIPGVPAGTFNLTHNFTSESTAHTSSLDLSNVQSAEISMSGVEPTLFKDIRYEIETHGYSEIGTLTAPRTVLYGDKNRGTHTYATSESANATWNDGTPRAAAFASQSVSRFRILTTIEEPFGPGIANPNVRLFLNSLTSEIGTEGIGSNFNLPINQDTLLSTFNEGNISSSISNYINGNLRTAVTSSWIGESITSLPIFTNQSNVENYKITSSLTYNMDQDWIANNLQIIDSTNETTLNLFNVPPTEITYRRFLTEKDAYGENDTSTTTRTILYGDPSITNDGTGSGESGEHFAGHDNSIPYASSSVTRFKTQLVIKEPVGHLHSDTTIVKQWSSSAHNNIDRTFTFNSSSQPIPGNYSSPYINNKLTLNINTDFLGQILSSSNQGGTTWTYTGSIFHPNESGLNTVVPIKSTVRIYDTPDVIITRGIPLIETFGDSKIGVSNENGGDFEDENRILLAGRSLTFPSSALGNEPLNEAITASAVLRIQNQLKITEPLGYAHKNITSSIFTIKNTDGLSAATNGPEVFNIFEYNTSSANLHTFDYNENFLLISSYTSSFDSGGLSLPKNGYVYQHDSVNFSFSNPVSESLNANNTSKQLAFEVKSSPLVQITNLSIEVEKDNSGSNQGASSRNTQILFGKTKTETDITTNNTYPNDNSKHQLVSARILFSQLDPIGITHFTPTVIIKGAENQPTITFNTASSTDYNADPNTTVNGLLTHYTSSFFPLEFTEGNSQIISASVSKVDDLGTLFTSSSNSTLATINVAASDTTNITISSTTLSGDINANNQFIFKSTHTDANDALINVNPTFNVNEPTLRTMASVIFPTHLDKTFSVESNQTDAFFADTNPDNGIGTLRMDSSDIKSNTTPETTVVRSTVSTLANLPADSDFNDKTITIIPAQPKSMNSDSFTTKTFSGHPASMENSLYTAALPLGLTYYKSGDNGTDPTSQPSTSTKIYKIGLGEGSNITLHTHTNGTADYTGNYTNNNRAYNFGDSGSLKLLISGTVAATYNLQDNFDPENKTTDQAPSAINFTGDFSGKGNLTINKIQPFNGVSDSVLDGSTLYPNGYQAWDATVNITSRLQDGYTTIQLVHEFDDASLNQTINLVDWYYDEGVKTPNINSNFNTTYNTYSSTPIFSLSGVQYFIEDTEFLFNLNNLALDIPHDTFRSSNNVAQTVGVSGIYITSGSSGIGSNTSLNHTLTNVSNKNGLIFKDKDFNVITPTSESDVTASIQNIRVKGINVSNTTDGGETRSVTFKLQKRDESSANAFNTTSNEQLIVVGRFAEPTSSTDTRLMEDFSSERYRWAHNVDTNFWAGVGPWNDTSNPNYNSETNILSTNDLQQVLTEKLVYPIINFNETTSLPNSVDYREAQNGDRYYYRAFEFQSSDFGVGASLSNISFAFNLEITSTFTESELINVDGGIESKDIKIDVRIPNGGTEWGVVSSEIPKAGVIYNDVGSEGWLARNMGQDIIVNSDTIKIPITLHSVKLNKASGIILVRIRLKTSSTSKEISKIEFTV